MISLQQTNNLEDVLTLIYCFTDDFIKNIVHSIDFAIETPSNGNPPIKTTNLSVAELTSLAIFRYFTGHTNWKSFYNFINTYHKKDFKDLPTYGNFLNSINKLSVLGMIVLQGFMNVFKRNTLFSDIKITDSTKLKVCGNKRIFNHKVMKDIAKRGKSSMGWFYGFKLHIICNELMQVLSLKITPGNTDDRKGLDQIWNDIFGIILADAGYIGKNWQDKARRNGKFLFTCVKKSMKKLMTSAEQQILRLRQKVETVFSVLKLRMGIESTLPRSPLGYQAHYIWCLVAYQFKQYLKNSEIKARLA